MIAADGRLSAPPFRPGTGGQRKDREQAHLMASDLDLWQAAQWVLDHHSDPDGWISARIKVLAGAGDVDGVLAWTNVLGKVNELRRGRPAPGEAVH